MTDAQAIALKFEEIRRQLAINVEIAERDHPEGPVVDGGRVSALPHPQAILAGHVTDRLADLEALFSTALAAKDAELAAVRENCETVCNSYADENQRLFDRAERAEARLAEAKKALDLAVSRGCSHCADSIREARVYAGGEDGR